MTVKDITKNRTELHDYYFYKGKYRTEEGLKRALIKDGIVTVSPKQNYYCYEEYTEYCYPYAMMLDYAYYYEWCSEEELKHFRKWLNQKIKNGEIIVCNTSWYHCDENDGMGTDWWDCLEAVKEGRDRFDPKWPDDFIEEAEWSIEEYCQTLTDEEFAEFKTLPEKKQYRIAMRWRIDIYNKAKAVEAR